jgi:hypothetical protein
MAQAVNYESYPQQYGVVIPKGLHYLRAKIPLILEDAEQPLATMDRGFIHRL